MKKLKWYTLNAETDRPGKEERKLRAMVKRLYRFCMKNGLNYAEVYYLDSDNSATVNIRAKKLDNTVVNSYAFIKG